MIPALISFSLSIRLLQPLPLTSPLKFLAQETKIDCVRVATKGKTGGVFECWNVCFLLVIFINQILLKKIEWTLKFTNYLKPWFMLCLARSLAFISGLTFSDKRTLISCCCYTVQRRLPMISTGTATFPSQFRLRAKSWASTKRHSQLITLITLGPS